MPKKILFIVLAGLLLFSGCQQRGSFEVKASNDNFRLTIERSALPFMTNPNSIIVSEIQPDETLTTNGEEPLAVYKLQPEGLKLSKPAKVELKVDISGSRFPGLYHISEDYGFEQVKDVETLISDGKATMKAEIDHFSDLVILYEDFDITIKTPSFVFVGQTFDVTGSIQKITQKRELVFARSSMDRKSFEIWARSFGLNPDTLSGKVIVGEVEVRDPWSVEDKLMADDASPVTPITHQEPRQDVSGNSHTYTKQFTCDAPGMIRIRYSPALRTPNAIYISRTPTSVSMSFDNSKLAADSDLFECVAFLLADASMAHENTLYFVKGSPEYPILFNGSLIKLNAERYTGMGDIEDFNQEGLEYVALKEVPEGVDVFEVRATNSLDELLIILSNGTVYKYSIESGVIEELFSLEDALLSLDDISADNDYISFHIMSCIDCDAGMPEKYLFNVSSKRGVNIGKVHNFQWISDELETKGRYMYREFIPTEECNIETPFMCSTDPSTLPDKWSSFDEQS
jgi:hypothetical protein